MSNNGAGPGPSSTTNSINAVAPGAEKKPLDQLGALEEDDEFEEFPAEDWPESETTLATLTAALKSKSPNSSDANSNSNGAAGAGPGAQLWEDNWDDDDKESAFVTQLRAELQNKQEGGDAMKM